MARGKQKLEEVQDNEAAEVAGIEGIADSFDPDPYFARGDCRDAMLNMIRSSVDWGKFDEARQRDINAAVDTASATIIQKLSRAIAAEGRITIPATIDQVVIKDGLKIVLKASFDPEAIVSLANAKAVEIAINSAEEFLNERAPARVDPDQADLISGDDSDLVDAADPKTDIASGDDGLMRTGDAIHIEGQGDCEIEINIKTGMVEATPRNGDAMNRIDVREATSAELAAERERQADFTEEPEPAAALA